MKPATVLLTALSAQRLVELVIARRHTTALRAKGAYEVGASHYPLMVTFHAGWLATLWALGRRRPLDGRFVAAFAVLQAGRLWVLRTLGERWTTRVMILPGAEPITSGPFRFVRHPNYLVVACEIPCVPLALGLPWIALGFGLGDLAVLALRISVENAAYAALAAGASPEAAELAALEAALDAIPEEDPPYDARS